MKKSLLISLFIGTVSFVLIGCGSFSNNMYRDDMGLVGAYSNVRPVTNADLSIYRTATAGTKYDRYSPIHVSTQVVSGTNYRFTCEKKPNGRRHEITVYQPLPGRGNPTVTSSKRSKREKQDSKKRH